MINAVDSNGVLIFWNKMCEEVTGYSADEMLNNSNAMKVLYPDDEYLERANRERVENNFQLDSAELILRAKDGTNRSVVWTNTDFSTPNRIWAVGIDITERKVAEDALRQYAYIVSSSTDIQALVSKDYVYKTANPTYMEAFGLNTEQLIGRRVLDVFGEEFFYTLIKPKADICLSGEEVKYQAWVNFPIYGKRFMEITYYPYTNATDEVQGFVVNGRDITESKFAKEEKANLEAQLQRAQKMEAIGTFAGGIAHDFNNILYIISGNVDLLMGEESFVNSSMLQAISDAAKRGTNLVNRLLTFSRKTESNFKSIDLKIEIVKMVRFFEQLIPKMIRIETSLDNDLYMVDADITQIEQVILNLCLNARDAMPDGGTLTIRVENGLVDDSLIMEFSELQKGRCVILTISDSGCGIDEEILNRIFDPFFTTKGVGKGTGLGLSVVYGIINTHKGSIFCQSKVGKGTTFKIYFPVSKELEELETAKIIEKSDSSGGGETILMVDDSEGVNELTKAFLEPFGYKVVTATRGESAVEIYSKLMDEIDLILLDLNMPGMGGKKSLKKLLEINPEAKVVIASGYGGDGPVKEILKDGAKAYIVKPFSQDEIRSLVKNVLAE